MKHCVGRKCYGFRGPVLIGLEKDIVTPSFSLEQILVCSEKQNFKARWHKQIDSYDAFGYASHDSVIFYIPLYLE